MEKRIVITGVGAVTPLGAGARTLHDRWCAGDSGIADGLARCDDFAPEDHLSRKLARRSDRFTQLAFVAAAEALEQAGWETDAPPYDADRVGCIVGTGIGGIGTLLAGYDVLDYVPDGPRPLTTANRDAVAISNSFGFGGHNAVLCIGASS